MKGVRGIQAHKTTIKVYLYRSVLRKILKLELLIHDKKKERYNSVCFDRRE
jgi:hypothetical protein